MNSEAPIENRDGDLPEHETGLALLQEARQILHTLQEAATELGSDQSEVGRLLAAAKTSLEDARGHASVAEGLRTSIESASAVAAEKSKHIEDARIHADSVRAALDGHLTKVQQIVAQAESLLARVHTAHEGTLPLVQKAGELKDKAEKHAEAAEAAETSAASSVAHLKSQVESSEKNAARVEALLSESEALNEKSAQRLTDIESLLPGAASAGLAHSFSERRKSFKLPSLVWQGIFIASLLALCALAWTGLSDLSARTAWSELLLHWISRLPIVASLIWLALHASREAAFSRRLEEEYAFKVAIASAFVGFEKQMAAVGERATPGTPLHRLCEDTLRTLAEPPGRIYDQHELTITPASSVSDSMSGKE